MVHYVFETTDPRCYCGYFVAVCHYVLIFYFFQRFLNSACTGYVQILHSSILCQNFGVYSYQASAFSWLINIENKNNACCEIQLIVLSLRYAVGSYRTEKNYNLTFCIEHFYVTISRSIADSVNF